jgi:hypothetical protein
MKIYNGEVKKFEIMALIVSVPFGLAGIAGIIALIMR